LMPSCFVIMPFSRREQDVQLYPENHWIEVYHGLLRPAVLAAGFECHRDDDDLSTRNILVNIWKKLEEADVVLCDVSSSNPNVFMELGWALRAEKPCVIVMDDQSKAPFDVADLNRFHYHHTLRPLALADEIPKLSRMIAATLRDSAGRWSIIRDLGIPSPRMAKRARPKCTVDIYYHERTFTRSEANRLAELLQQNGIDYHLMEHTGPTEPDAVFFGALVEASDARLILSFVPYEIKFLFRPDYPESEGGDSLGYKIGIGYTSRYNEGLRIARAAPVPVSTKQLSSLMDPNRTNTSFQRELWNLPLRSVGRKARP